MWKLAKIRVIGSQTQATGSQFCQNWGWNQNENTTWKTGDETGCLWS
jgi:hypothetical protein